MRRTAKALQTATGRDDELAYVDQDYTSEQAWDDAEDHGIMLHFVKLSEAKRRFVLLLWPRWSSGASRG